MDSQCLAPSKAITILCAASSMSDDFNESARSRNSLALFVYRSTVLLGGDDDALVDSGNRVGVYTGVGVCVGVGLSGRVADLVWFQTV